MHGATPIIRIVFVHSTQSLTNLTGLSMFVTKALIELASPSLIIFDTMVRPSLIRIVLVPDTQASMELTTLSLVP